MQSRAGPARVCENDMALSLPCMLPATPPTVAEALQMPNHGSPAECNRQLFEWWSRTFAGQGTEPVALLDVGGGTGEKGDQLRHRLRFNRSHRLDTVRDLKYECIDVVAAPHCPQVI